jgi:hypothetical protein
LFRAPPYRRLPNVRRVQRSNCATVRVSPSPVFSNRTVRGISTKSPKSPGLVRCRSRHHSTKANHYKSIFCGELKIIVPHIVPHSAPGHLVRAVKTRQGSKRCTARFERSMDMMGRMPGIFDTASKASSRCSGPTGGLHALKLRQNRTSQFFLRRASRSRPCLFSTSGIGFRAILRNSALRHACALVHLWFENYAYKIAL